MANNGRNFVVQQRRAECLTLVLQWRGATLADGEVERSDLASQDDKLNTGLHYCAASGLKRCVEVILMTLPKFIFQQVIISKRIKARTFDYNKTLLSM